MTDLKPGRSPVFLGHDLGILDRRHVLARNLGWTKWIFGSVPQGRGERVGLLASDPWQLAPGRRTNDEGIDGVHHNRCWDAKRQKGWCFEGRNDQQREMFKGLNFGPNDFTFFF